MIEERQAKTSNGYTAIVVLFFLQIGGLVGIGSLSEVLWLILFPGSIIVFICWFGFFMVNPNESRVMQLFGSYAGSEGQDRKSVV